MPTVLAVGCGPDPMQEWRDRGYEVVRLDADPAVAPDIVASMTSLGEIGPFDVVYCSHALEHIYPHEVPTALAEFHRVLVSGGIAMVVVPDLPDIAPTDDVIPGMGITGLDMFYGNSREIPDRPYMAHHCGFVADTLGRAVTAAGFETKTVRMDKHNLMAIGTK